MHDPYLIPGTGVLRNKLGIVGAAQLRAAERRCATVGALCVLEAGRPLHASMSAWSVIHNSMFRDVYDWAGRCRTIDLAYRRGKDCVTLCPPARIPAEGAGALTSLKSKLRESGNDPDAMLSHLADAYVSLLRVRPFRAGNVRSQMVFFTMLARPYGLALDWDGVDARGLEDAGNAAIRGDDDAPMRSLLIDAWGRHRAEADEDALSYRRP